jgi:chloride channel protein, CIC family
VVVARTVWLAVLLGAAVGVLAALYLRAIRLLTDLVWDGAEPRLPGDGAWQVVAVCAAGGALVGLIRGRHDRDTPHDLDDALGALDDVLGDQDEVKPLPKVSWLLRAAVLGVVSLAAGASLGPEAPLVVLATGLGERLARILRTTRQEAAFLSSAGAISGLFGGPLGAVVLPVERSRSSQDSVRLLGAGLVAAVSGLIAMFVVLPGEGLHRYELPDVTSASGLELLQDVGWVALTSAAASIAGVVLLLGTLPGRRLAERAVPTPVLRAALGGVVLGLCGVLDPLSLFSGEHQGQELIDSLGDKTALALAALVALKLVATLACLCTGWFGGQIFPTIFAGMTVGMVLATVFDGAPAGILVAGGAAAAGVVVLRRPLAVVLILLLFFPLGSSVGLAEGAAVGLLVVSLLGDRVPQPEHAAP